MMKKELTIIIPFLNEGEEVERTLASLKNKTKEKYDIILINDCSNDGYDYKVIAQKFGAKYILNEHRLGVARCRDMGVEMSRTDYFLLLDAHMRVYDAKWYDKLMNHIRNSQSTLFCCQSKVLLNICGAIKEVETLASNTTFGAYIKLNPHGVDFLDAAWITNSSNETNDKDVTFTQEIPCVLGAGYACSKNYWIYLHGLSGLQKYGIDEQFISLKVWMSGGKCELIKDVVFGHIYRNIAPYEIKSIDIIYNKLLTARILFPVEYIDAYEELLKRECHAEYDITIKMIEESENFIRKERSYFNTMLRKSISEILCINKQKQQKQLYKEENAYSLEYILAHVLSNPNEAYGIGLLTGKAGIAFIYMMLAKKELNTLFELIADKLIQQVWDECTTHTPMSFASGLLGVGWLCEYLCQNRMVIGNPDDILDDIDKMVCSINPAKIQDMSLDDGLLGIFAYVQGRIIGCHTRKTVLPFGEQFINEVINAAKFFWESVNKEACGFLNINAMTDVHSRLTKSSFLDIINMSNFKESPICVCIQELLYLDK